MYPVSEPPGKHKLHRHEKPTLVSLAIAVRAWLLTLNDIVHHDQMILAFAFDPTLKAVSMMCAAFAQMSDDSR